MGSKYPELSSEYEIKEELVAMGVDVFEPTTRSEQSIAQMLDEFSSFVLHDGKEKCLEILEEDLYNGGSSVGELQGGSDSFSIYRVSFPPDELFNEDSAGAKKCKNAAIQLVREFNDYNQRHKRNNKNALTLEKIKQYMLGMCDRRSKERCCKKYTSLGNLMFILQFGGPTQGQVRHIDNMVPNLQICLYMSQSCPSTVVYAMEDDGMPVVDGKSLIELWERKYQIIPPLLKEILQHQSGRALKSKWYTKSFSFWKSINIHLRCFGKLYQPVSFQLGLQTDPGTTLIAGGNEVHAGPATNGSRMFAFAIGIPEDDSTDDNEDDKCLMQNEKFGDDDNDGEVQYSPVLLHIDFCCLLFSIIDYEHGKQDEDAIKGTKYFLVNILIELIKDYPMKGYLRQIDPERVGVLNWLENVLDSLENTASIATLVDNAIASEEIFYTLDIIKRRSKKKKKRK